jgi:alkylated DNA repair dioxygenase AlkB
MQDLTYVSNFLSKEEELEAIKQIDALPWRDDLKRRVQHYGYVYDYKLKTVNPSMYLGPLPDFADYMAERLVELNLFKQKPDQLIVNEYKPGQGIAAHVDCIPCFGNQIATISLSWAYEMNFIHIVSHETEQLLLERGSVLVMEGVARYHWMHQIKSKRNDRGVKRERRISMTFRNVIIEEQK